jgi:hypothetical protein
MKPIHYALCAITLSVLTGCIDSDYDLSDIDTTARFAVKDLVLPINLEPVVLDDVVDLTDNDCIEVIDGEYVLIKDGTFSSEEVNIRNIQTQPTVSHDPVTEVYSQANVQPGDYTVDLVTADGVRQEFSYIFNNVDEYIRTIDSGQVDFDITVALHNSGATPVYKNLVFKMPAGFVGTASNGGKVSSRDDANGKRYYYVTFDTAKPTNGTFEFVYHVEKFDVVHSNAVLNAGVEGQSGSFIFQDEITLDNGVADFTSTKEADVSIKVEFQLSELLVHTITGNIYYKVQGLDVDDIDLDDMPEELGQEETELHLRNPQIYVHIANPLWSYGVTARTGLDIYQVRNGVKLTSDGAHLVKPIDIAAAEGDQVFCLSPERPETYHEGAAETFDKNWREFSNLGNIVSGSGLPEALAIDFDSPQMNEHHVVDFRLGRNLGSVSGTYTFYAPLAMTDESKIVYTQTQTGWGSEDLDAVDITVLEVEGDVTSTLPFDVYFSAHPVNTDGQVINDVDIEGGYVPANATNHHLTMKITGEIQHLDGMRYTARVVGSEAKNAITPDQNISISNIKAKVSGSYTKEL